MMTVDNPRSAVAAMDSRGAWWAVAATLIGVACSTVPVAVIPMSVFLKPFGAMFHWGRAEISLALTLVTITTALATPVAGKIIDAFGPRRSLMASVILFSCSVAITPLLIEQAGLSGLYLAYAAIGICGATCGTVAYLHLLSGWFDKYRGLALGIGMSGFSLGAALTPPLASFCITHYNWQAGFYALAALPIIVALPVVALFVKDPPLTHNADLDGAGWSAAAALRSWVFWVLFAVFFLVAMGIHGVQLHSVALVSDLGFKAGQAVAGVSILFGASIVARMAAGALLDVAFGPHVSAALFALSFVGFPVLIFAHSLSAAYLGLALVGVGAGVETDVLGYLVSRYFGRVAFGQIYGFVYFAFMSGTAIGPFVFGLSFDRAKSYAPALAFTGGGLALACVLLMFLPRFEFVRPPLAAMVRAIRRDAPLENASTVAH
jgi:MFS family permease